MTARNDTDEEEMTMPAATSNPDLCEATASAHPASDAVPNARLGDADLEALARRGRWLLLSTAHAVRSGHVGGSMSAMDMLVALYFDALRIDPTRPNWPDRDRFILSKGHCGIGLYTVLAMRGYFPIAELPTFDQGGSRLQMHPDMQLLPGIDISTGSLGQGLSAGFGMALGARTTGSPAHVFVMLGDGEMQEGMTWEALHVAPRYPLGNLTVMVDLNGLQQYGWTPESGSRGDRRDPWAGADLPAVFRGLGWRVLEIDGHDMAQIRNAFRAAKDAAQADRPTAILARTVKGKGVSFTEMSIRWHTGAPDDAQLAAIRAELGVQEDA